MLILIYFPAVNHFDAVRLNDTTRKDVCGLSSTTAIAAAIAAAISASSKAGSLTASTTGSGTGAGGGRLWDRFTRDRLCLGGFLIWYIVEYNFEQGQYRPYQYQYREHDRHTEQQHL